MKAPLYDTLGKQSGTVDLEVSYFGITPNLPLMHRLLVLQQAKIGVPLDEALENLKKRVYTEDNEMFVTSITILRETGGNLAETFDTIVSVIRERVRLQLKIDTYIASGKIQAYIIGAMPFLMIIMFGSGDPEYFPLLFGTLLGVIALIIIVGMVALGMWVIMKIIDIKV